MTALKEHDEMIHTEILVNSDENTKNEELKKQTAQNHDEDDDGIATLTQDGRLEKRLKQLFAQNMKKTAIIDEKAYAAIERIKAKLSGKDFNEYETLTISGQIDKLVNQATSPENLCQAYLGWNPFL